MQWHEQGGKQMTPDAVGEESWVCVLCSLKRLLLVPMWTSSVRMGAITPISSFKQPGHTVNATPPKSLNAWSLWSSMIIVITNVLIVGHQVLCNIPNFNVHWSLVTCHGYVYCQFWIWRAPSLWSVQHYVVLLADFQEWLPTTELQLPAIGQEISEVGCGSHTEGGAIMRWRVIGILVLVYWIICRMDETKPRGPATINSAWRRAATTVVFLLLHHSLSSWCNLYSQNTWKFWSWNHWDKPIWDRVECSMERTMKH